MLNCIKVSTHEICGNLSLMQNTLRIKFQLFSLQNVRLLFKIIFPCLIWEILMHKCHKEISLVSEVLEMGICSDWRPELHMPLHIHSAAHQDLFQSARFPCSGAHTTGAISVEPEGTWSLLQPGPGSKSADPFQMHPWTMHQNSAAASSSVGMGLGPRVGLCQCRPGWTRQIDLCDVWPTLTPVCGQAGWIVSHGWCPPVLWSEISLFMLGRGDASSSRVTDHYSD